MDILAAIGLGLGLAAACGMRVFLPLLAAAIATRVGLLNPGPGFDWIASWPALLMLGVASAAETAAYYIPWVDHALDAIATPAAAIAGALIAATQLGLAAPDSIHPALKWIGGAAAGGGIASAVQLSTVGLRGLSTATTAGLGNAFVATLENIGAVILSILALIVPVLLVLLIAAFGLLLLRRHLRRRRLRRANPAAAAPSPVPALSPAPLNRA